MEIVENPSQQILREYFQRAKIFCALSYKEGSYIGVAEALMAGTPVVMFKNAKIGTKALISPSYGALVSTISELREKILFYNKFDAHARVKKYAQDFVSSYINCQRLNKMLKDYAISDGENWTCDIEEIY